MKDKYDYGLKLIEESYKEAIEISISHEHRANFLIAGVSFIFTLFASLLKIVLDNNIQINSIFLLMIIIMLSLSLLCLIISQIALKRDSLPCDKLLDDLKQFDNSNDEDIKIAIINLYVKVIKDIDSKNNKKHKSLLVAGVLFSVAILLIFLTVVIVIKGVL